jgi:tellurite resistance protein TerC
MWLWVGFHVFILILLSFDLGVSKRRELKQGPALLLSLGWIGIALLFNGFVYWYHGPEKALEFFTAYLIEKSLSIDNLFVFMLVFASFKVPKHLQYKILYLGIVGAFILRLVMILAGVYLITMFHWLTYVLGLIVGITGIRLILKKKETVNLKKNWLLKWVQSHYNITDDYVGDKFSIVRDGVKYLTPLFLVLVVIESTDVIFALDSIPAVLAVTHDPFIAYTSNVFAVIGLRALYFLLAPWMDLFPYFKTGLGVILGFIGFKMIVSPFFSISLPTSLTIIASVIVFSILYSIVKQKNS